MPHQLQTKTDAHVATHDGNHLLDNTMHCTDTKTTEQRQPFTSGGEAAFVGYRMPVALMAVSGVRLLICESSDHPSQRADTSCQIRLQLQSSVSAHMSPCPWCHCVIAPLHSPTSSVAILNNRVASPNMLPTHLATTLSGSIDIFSPTEC